MTDPTILKAVRIFTDAICLVIVCLPTIIAIYDPSVQPFRRGFYCDDESIMKPYKGSTVPWNLCISVAVLLPSITIAVIELIHYLYNPARLLLPKFTIGPIRINHYLWTLYRFLGVYFYGLAICMSFKDMGKYTIGRLRPHFLAVCQPDEVLTNCSVWPHRYIEEQVCTGDPVKILEARQSFPSGHSALSFFAMVYAAMYLQSRMNWHGTAMLRHALQAVYLWLAYYCALSRISDYKHHWSDVLSGTILGIVSAALTVYCMVDSFAPPDYEKSGSVSCGLASVNVESAQGAVIDPTRRFRDTGKINLTHAPNAIDIYVESTEMDRVELP